ncbi:sulfur oxidation c-type cytochrome SoxA [Rhodoblastus acidophilus]|uniref:SoxAX cytochrome complex subunit A n=1 Tax=Rhodoblastus acidophilus TaxID=1074 RepID=A0A6N8DHN7_RHOAC|nr:sulfur oxidation c-type cytochrome SoxA [Rhodoblastus acidophilus]MCW2272839.1 sulfur-oxidizing protein SoxA [Rhodoblastus acidophilus]MTV29747.1 sulfur oxidation c-type cytochrome SoxA [Rhodoblastus acidophilus]
MKRHHLCIAFAAVISAGAARAETDSSLQSIEQYREALRDGNPAELFEAQGEEIWKTPAGPKNVSLEQCDLGLGAGVVKGAFAQLPRWFKDTDRVQDTESRLLTCKEKLQGVDIKAIIKAPFGSPEKDEMNALVTYISGASKDMPVKVSLAHPKEQAMFNLGRRMFYFEAGPHDFSCATCHGQSGARIRLQELPDLTIGKGAGVAWTSWPAYRVSSGQMWSMQWRLADCFRQQRFPEPNYTSDVTVALSMFMAAMANDAKLDTPGIKR